MEVLVITIGGTALSLGFNWALNEFYIWRERVAARRLGLTYNEESH